MTDDPKIGEDETAIDDEETTPSGPPEKMSPGFYVAFGLIIILVVMIFVWNVPAARMNAGIELTNTNWTLRALMDTNGILVPVISGSEVTAQFNRSQGRMDGHSGCNWYSALYTTKDYAVTLKREVITDMACWDPAVTEQESVFLADLSRPATYSLSDSTLKFYDAAGKTVFVFVPV
ncbi:MAG: META domain-containing protein [Methanoregula sp.]|jgi:heat shock protein HslJ